MTVGEAVKKFYDEFGWVKRNGEASGEDRLFRAFPAGYDSYASGSAERTRFLFEGRTGRLLIVGGGDLPDSHLDIARQFSSVTCMDISERAIEISRQKLGSRAEYVLGSIVDTAHDGGQYDAVLCAHVVYHIDAREQERAVRQMVRLARPGGRVVVIYSNPQSPFLIPGRVGRAVKRALGKGRFLSPTGTPHLYYHAHPLRWWQRFKGDCSLSFVPWEVAGSRPTLTLLRSDRAARAFYRLARWAETRFPALAVRLWQYPTVILDKR
jgi:SAM-dependent methyltransferase